MNAKIEFYADSHTYWHDVDSIPSVGSYLDMIFPSFDREYWLTYKTLSNIFPEKFSIAKSGTKSITPSINMLLSGMKLSQSEILFFFEQRKKLQDQWKKEEILSSKRGTDFHIKAETRAYEQNYLINPFDKKKYEVIKKPKHPFFDNYSISDNLFDINDGVHLELVVFDPHLKVCGQVDMAYVETIKGVRYIDIDDHKTTKKKPEKSSMQNCLAPIDWLPASKHNKYCCQISFYAYILEMWGFTVRKLGYTHYKNYDLSKPNLIKIDYLPSVTDYLYNSFYLR